MSSQREGLLARIEQGVVDPDVTLSSLLNMCLVLGGQAGSAKLRDWARNEANGYAGSRVEGFPDYRMYPTAFTLKITNRMGYQPITQQIRNADLPKPIREQIDVELAPLTQGVGSLEAMARAGEPITLSPDWAPLLAAHYNKIGERLNSQVAGAYWQVPPHAFEGLLSRIRAVLADLVAELISETPIDQEVPDKRVIDNAIVQFVIQGDNNTVDFTSLHAAEGGTNTVDGLSTTAVTASDGATAAGSLSGGDNSTVVAGQNVSGNENTVAGRDVSTPQPVEKPKDTWWTRWRKRGILVGLATIVAAVAAVWTLAGWPWPF